MLQVTRHVIDVKINDIKTLHIVHCIGPLQYSIITRNVISVLFEIEKIVMVKGLQLSWDKTTKNKRFHFIIHTETCPYINNNKKMD